ncbi:hypothetical protein Tco_1406882 [Tanacetum coccineum]
MGMPVHVGMGMGLNFIPVVDTAYWEDLIRHIEFESVLIVVEIDLTWSLEFVSVELGRLPNPLSCSLDDSWIHSPLGLAHVLTLVLSDHFASVSFSSEYSRSESRLKSSDLNSSRLRVLKCLLDDQNYCSDDRYAVSNGSGYAVLINWDEYAVLDRELDTPYSTFDQNNVFKKNN